MDRQSLPVEPQLIIPVANIDPLVDGADDRAGVAVVTRDGDANVFGQRQLDQRRQVEQSQLQLAVIAVRARRPGLGVDDSTRIASKRGIVGAGIKVHLLDEPGMHHPASDQQVKQLWHPHSVEIKAVHARTRTAHHVNRQQRHRRRHPRQKTNCSKRITEAARQGPQLVSTQAQVLALRFVRRTSHGGLKRLLMAGPTTEAQLHLAARTDLGHEPQRLELGVTDLEVGGAERWFQLEAALCVTVGLHHHVTDLGLDDSLGKCGDRSVDEDPSAQATRRFLCPQLTRRRQHQPKPQQPRQRRRSATLDGRTGHSSGYMMAYE